MFDSEIFTSFHFMEIKYLNDHPICFPGPNTTVFLVQVTTKSHLMKSKQRKFALITAKLYICPGAKSLSPQFGLVSRIWISEPGLNCNNTLGFSLISLLTTVVFPTECVLISYNRTWFALSAWFSLLFSRIWRNMAAGLLFLVCAAAVLYSAEAWQPYNGLPEIYKKGVNLVRRELTTHSKIRHRYQFLKSVDKLETEVSILLFGCLLFHQLFPFFFYFLMKPVAATLMGCDNLTDCVNSLLEVCIRTETAKI